MSEMNVNQLLHQMRQMEAMAKAQGAGTQNSTEATDFSSLLKSAVGKVNETQMEARKLAAAFESGDPQVNMTEVSLALQKASLSFQAMTQVRNRLVGAYQDIMKMPI